MSTAAATMPGAAVQRLILFGYRSQVSRHFVLTVDDGFKARTFLTAMRAKNWISAVNLDQTRYGTPAETPDACWLNIGFTFAGLEALELPGDYLHIFQDRARAFAEGAYERAANRLADTGPSTVDRWEEGFKPAAAHVLLSLHADREAALEQRAQALRNLPAADGLLGWDQAIHRGQHLTGDPDCRTVHFGFRDGITSPRIEGIHTPRDGTSANKTTQDWHKAGEFLLGHENDDGFNPWLLPDKAQDITGFFRNSSFGVFRKIEQDVEEFERFVQAGAAKLNGVHPDFVKAKLCGRWPNGMLVVPGAATEPALPMPPSDLNDFDFSKDPQALGCPFGAHIRRLNPRADPVVPFRRRPLIRRGMPYGTPLEKEPASRRGLLGLFFCASIEDQFEHLIADWGNKNPLGPDHRGNAKDPLIGNHDDTSAEFALADATGKPVSLDGFTPFVTTRGTLYAFFPSLHALGIIAEGRKSIPDPYNVFAPAPGDTAAPDRFCDVVLTGGVTSGIVYPPALMELAKSYHFKNIGGASAGAMAAALVAAAEYSRRRGSMSGFAVLDAIPKKLADPPEGADGQPISGITTLLSLFQPAPGLQRLFDLFLRLLALDAYRTCCGKALGAAWALTRTYGSCPIILFAAIALSLIAGTVIANLTLAAPGWAADLGAIGLLLLLALLIGGSLIGRLLYDLLVRLPKNNFGVCNGGPVAASTRERPPLTIWLHRGIQQAAGRKEDDTPLTFGDLWDAPGFPPRWMTPAAGQRERSIDLRMVTTNLTHGRPYLLPGADALSRLFFRREEWEPYFPKSVMEHLVKYAVPYRPVDTNSDPAATEARSRLLELPSAQLPVVVAARLSLSFPVLFCAVPLYAIDYEAPMGKRGLRRCWFSDGGITSNFPVHLFDAVVPRWPTFGISLGQRSVHRPLAKDAVWIPQHHLQGRGDSWDRFSDTRVAPMRMLGFIRSVLISAKDWKDNTQMRMPGVRERVVRIGFGKDEGELNLDMPAEKLNTIARDYGATAGRALLEKFAATAGGSARGWDEHRWVRFNVLIASLREYIEGFAQAAEDTPYCTPLSKQILQACAASPLHGSGPDEAALTSACADALQEMLAGLQKLEQAFGRANVPQPYRPTPEPVLAVRPPV